MITRRYSELKNLKTFEERFEYLKLGGEVAKQTFGVERYLNQNFYKSKEWRQAKRDVIARDYGRDLGIEGRDISDRIIVHHMNPITIEDIENGDPKVLDPEYLICVSHNTHNAIHYGDGSKLIKDYIPRSHGDTCPWK